MITAKPSTSVNPTSNSILERICQVLENLVWNFNIKQTFVDGDDTWFGILPADEFIIISTTNGLKGFSPGQLLFCRDMVLLIKHKVDWELIRQQNHMQINKDNIHENINRSDHNYKVGDEFIITNKIAYKYGNPFNGPFLITQCCKNGTVKLQSGSTYTTLFRSALGGTRL